MNPSGWNPDSIGSGFTRSKPRFMKLRKHDNSSNNSKSKLFNLDSGFNPFRSGSDILLPELTSSFEAKLSFGNVGNEAFVFGSKTGNACGVVESKVADDLKKLKIETKNPSDGSENSRLEEDIRKLKIGDSVFVESPENQNVKLFGRSAQTEHPNELKKMNIKDHKEPERSITNDGEDDMRILRGSTDGGNTSFPGSSAGVFSGTAESVLLNEMERLRLASEVGNTPSERHMGFSSCSDVSSLFHPKDFTFQTPAISNPSGRMFNSSVGKKLESNARRELTKDARSKKNRGKFKKPVQAWKDFVPSENTSLQEHQEDSSESYSPMDVSPYREPMDDNKEVRQDFIETSVALEEVSSKSLSTSVNEAATDEDLVIAAQSLDLNEDDTKFTETKVEPCQFGTSESFDANVPKDGFNSEAESESFVTADVQFDYDSSNDTFVTAADTEVSSSSRTITEMPGFSSGPTSEDFGGIETNFTFATAASSSHSQPSTSLRHQKKKNRYRVAHESYISTPSSKFLQSSSSMQLFQSSETSSLLSPTWGQKGDLPASFSKRGGEAEPVKDQEIEQKSSFIPSASVAAQEACDKWRLRGNQAYASGDMLRAEDYYSQGINCISQHEKCRSCLRVLMLCYSNRAATRMSLGRVREALGDCRRAAVIDPKFLRVQVRAANCYLVLGDVENASRHFIACLQSGNDACVDQKLALEASEGLEKSHRVSEWMKQSAELMQQRNTNAAESALRVISEALIFSAYSEKLLELKAEALFMLGKYEELISLCEQSLASAEMNHAAVCAVDSCDIENSDAQMVLHLRLWRWRLILKSYFCLGRLQAALDFLKKQEGSAEIRSASLESALPLFGIIQELVRNKGAGNEAFKSGNYAEAVEHYTAALSSTVESRPFAAVCFSNRAAAYKAMGRVIDAIADCNVAIALDGSYLKASSRRASLFEMIRDYHRATMDLHRVASLLAKQVEEKVGQRGPSDELNYNELRQVQQWQSTMEEEAKKEIPLNMYLILGVDLSVTAAEIKKAYRKAALRHHPDKACQSLARSDTIDDGLWKEVMQEVHKDADILFKMIGEAYVTLSDPIKRSRYDTDEEIRNAQKRDFGGAKSACR